MVFLYVALAIIFILFVGVIAFGAPFLPTLKEKVNPALDLLDLKVGDTLLELGCGDGRLLVAAAQRGIRGVGYELNPLLFCYAKLKTWRYRHMITLKCADYWRVDWPPADGMYVFLLQPYMPKLHKRLQAYKPRKKPFRLVSFAFTIEQKKPSKEHEGMALYLYK
jgi:SAM-dependent methyltransferase